MTRRGFFATLAAGLAASRIRKPALCELPGIEDSGSGISIRHIRHYDAKQDRWTSRMDVLYGLGDLQRVHNRMLSEQAEVIELAPARSRVFVRIAR